MKKIALKPSIFNVAAKPEDTDLDKYAGPVSASMQKYMSLGISQVTNALGAKHGGRSSTMRSKMSETPNFAKHEDEVQEVYHKRN